MNRPAAPPPHEYQRTRAGVLLAPNGDAIEVVMRGFGRNFGAAIKTAVLDLIDDGTGRSTAIVVNDSNMDGGGINLRYSLETGDLLDTLETGKTLLSEHKEGKLGFTVDPEFRARLACLPPSKAPAPSNVLAPRVTVWDKQSHETQEEYERRLVRNGFKPTPEAKAAELEAKHRAWQVQQLADSNIIAQNNKRERLPHEVLIKTPLEKPAKPKREIVTQPELIANHKQSAFSAGKEDEPLPKDPHFATLKV